MGVQQSLVVQNDMKLVPLRKKKVMKRGSMRRRQLRSLELFISNGRSCECPTLNSSVSTQQYLIMGRLEAGRAMVTFVSPFNKRDKDTKRAMRALKKTDICKSALAAITGDSDGDGSTTAAATSLHPTPTDNVRGGRRRNKGKGRGKGRGRGGNGRQRGNRKRDREERAEQRRSNTRRSRGR